METRTLGKAGPALTVVGLGCNNFGMAIDAAAADQVAAAAAAAEAQGWAAFTGTQIHWNLLHRDVEADVVPAAETAGLGVVPYFPLASGLLTGKYRRGRPFPEGSRLARSERFAAGATDENFDRVEAYEAFAAERGRTVTELAIAWLLAQPAVA